MAFAGFSGGYVVAANDFESGATAYVSVDGVTWTSISPRLEGPVELADGPAGVLLVGADSGRVWLLRP
jgi:hypothetical protein